MTCKHEHIQTWRFEDGEVAMWSCVECALKFEPITARADLEAEVARLRDALKNLADEFVRVYPIYYYAEPWSHKTNVPLLAARAALESKP